MRYTRSSSGIFAALLFALLLFAGAIAQAQVRVVTTTTDLAAIAQEVGGEHVSVTALAAPTQDPHYVDARPSLLVPMSRARLLIVNGLDLEIGWLPALLANARNRHINAGQSGYLDASRAVGVLGVPPPGTDRASGDVHPSGNPHYLFDARRARRVAEAIRDRLTQIEPSKAEIWSANTTRFVAEVDAFAREQRARFARLPAAQRTLVSYHSSLVYLFDWLQLQELITIEPHPGIDPTPRHTATVLQRMRGAGVTVIAQEEYYPRATSNTLASMTNGQVVVLHGATRFGQQRYIEHLREITDALYNALVRE